MTFTIDSGDLFFDHLGLDRRHLDRIVGDALSRADDGELFLEYRQSESLVLDDGRLKSAGFDISHGFGLRAVAGEVTGLAHGSDLGEESIRGAADTVRAVCQGYGGTFAQPAPRTNRALYGSFNPLALVPFEAKTRLLADIDAYARGKDERVRQVIASLDGRVAGDPGDPPRGRTGERCPPAGAAERHRHRRKGRPEGKRHLRHRRQGRL